MTNWDNNVYPGGNVTAASPIKLANAKPSWTMAADFVRSCNNSWSFDPDAGVAASGDGNLPAHAAKGGLPAGGNEVFSDCSARWVRAADMRLIHSYSGAYTRNIYFIQDDLGALEPYRSSLTPIE